MAKEQQNTQEPVETVDTLNEAELETAEPSAAEATQADVLQQLEESRAEVDALSKQLAELQPRAQAEIQNIRRRAEQDVEKAHKFGLEKFANELLPVVDSLERAIEASQGDDEQVTAIREGVEMTLNMFLASMAKFNVEQINPEQGDAFNPDHHQAMSMVPAEGVEPNAVVTVVQKGYLLNGRLMRPAMVMVAKG
ncbi:nucleotide exchange factor GrpE [Marinobacterium weihaiense]|uniref:Protein GrpE n=1 Tax=Marinobacterium weihaiense TaxID=2851016 RepID=A0ABS6M7X5_9GAMM|nr:nucleotide exchange factor GrpE [Marinobacterium weihaiense]MBV0932383.1 nucleotide exchange factor GrpE [Marinobacterium weihaiense]